jgi:hypothetical protein
MNIINWQFVGEKRNRLNCSQIPRESLAWIAKSRPKQSKYPLEIARFGNLAEPKSNFSGFSDSYLVLKNRRRILPPSLH